MKSLKYIFITLLSCMAFTGAIAQTKAEKSAQKTAQVKSWVDNQNFIFKAQYANPQRGGHRYLNSDYDLNVKKDSVAAYLPYFGQAYFDVPYNPTEGGIKFTSTDFTYNVNIKKKGGWDVTIVPKDAKYYQRIILNISTSGSCYTQFLITNKDAIAFDGYVTENKKRQ